MNIAIAAAAVLGIALLAIWFFSDKVVYKGQASVMPNNMKHYSATHRTVFVVPNQTIPGADIFIHTVNKSVSDALGMLNFRQVEIRRRLFQKPRVTKIS